MDKMDETEQSQAERGYEPRPTWQVHMARIGLALFIAFVIYQVIQIAGGWR